MAIKILEKHKICDVSDVERVSREIHILKLIRHPNIIQLYKIIETPKRLYLIMEYADGGELFDYIVSRTMLEESQGVRFYQQLIAGIEYIHKLGLCTGLEAREHAPGPQRQHQDCGLWAQQYVPGHRAAEDGLRQSVLRFPRDDSGQEV